MRTRPDPGHAGPIQGTALKKMLKKSCVHWTGAEIVTYYLSTTRQ